MDETQVTREATERIVKVIDNKYEKANLKYIAQYIHQLYEKEQVMLPHLLNYFE